MTDCPDPSTSAERQHAGWAPPSGVPPPRESTYRSPLRVGMLTGSALAGGMVVVALQIASRSRALQAVDRIERRPLSVSLGELDAIDRREQVLWVVSLVVGVVVIAMLAVLTRRLYRNARTYSNYPLRFTSGWAAGAWFVPFLSFVRPKQIVDDIWRATEPDQPAWWAPTRPPVSGLLHIWWAVSIFAAVTSRFGGSGDPANIDELRGSYQRAIASNVVTLTALLLTGLIVVSLVRRDHARHVRRRGGTDQPADRRWLTAIASVSTCVVAFGVGFVAFATAGTDGQASARPDAPPSDAVGDVATVITGKDDSAGGSTTTGTATDDLCSTLATALETHRSADHSTPQAAAAAARSWNETLRLPTDTAVAPNIRSELIDVRILVEGFTNALEVVGDRDVDADIVDEVTTSTFEVIDTGFMFVVAPTVSAQCPDLMRSQLAAGLAVTRFVRSVNDLLDAPGGDDPRLDELEEWVRAFEATEDRNTGEPSSTHADAFTACSDAWTVDGFGDDAGCDELQTACDDGDMDACNDLYWTSPVGSRYEAFAASCGNRTRIGQIGYAGFCDEITDP